MKKIKNYLKLMRVKHYLKNCLIFLPIIFGQLLFEVELYPKIIASFFAFCLLASMIYIINDMKDMEKDRNHFKKKFRPLASGAVSKKEAYLLLIILFIIVLALIIIFQFNYQAIICLVVYFILNILYSFGLKNIPILDICILASGFLIRLIYGAEIVDITISNWLYLTVMAMAFYLALGKRRNEIIKTNGQTREVLKYYQKEFLDKIMYMCLTLTIVFYALWTTDHLVIERISEHLIWTVPFVIIIVIKYSMNIEGNSDGDPIEVVFEDKILMSLIACYCVVMAGLLYLF